MNYSIREQATEQIKKDLSIDTIDNKKPFVVVVAFRIPYTYKSPKFSTYAITTVDTQKEANELANQIQKKYGEQISFASVLANQTFFCTSEKNNFIYR